MSDAMSYGPDATEVAEISAEQVAANELASVRAELAAIRYQHADQTATIDRQRVRITELESIVQTVRNDLYNARAEREQFSQRVVAVAERVASEQGWCRDGLRSALGELDLEPNPSSFCGTFTVEVSYSGCEADSEDDVHEVLSNALADVRVYGVSIDGWDIVDVSADGED